MRHYIAKLDKPMVGMPTVIQISEKALSDGLAAYLNDPYGIFYCINDLKGYSRTVPELKSLSCCFCDLDTPKVYVGSGCDQEEITSEEDIAYYKVNALRSAYLAPLPAHSIKETRSGVHLNYFFEELPPTKENLDKYTKAQNILNSYFNKMAGNCDDLKDPVRLLRMPGFYHCKGEPFLVEEKVKNEIPPYTLDEIIYEFSSFVSRPTGVKLFRREIENKKQKSLESLGVILGEQKPRFSDELVKIPIPEVFKILSGTEHVNYENITVINGQIWVNGKMTASWYDRKENKIGSHNGGGPTIIQWIKYYHKGKDYKEVKKYLHSAFKFLEKSIEPVKVCP